MLLTHNGAACAKHPPLLVKPAIGGLPFLARLIGFIQRGLLHRMHRAPAVTGPMPPAVSPLPQGTGRVTGLVEPRGALQAHHPSEACTAPRAVALRVLRAVEAGHQRGSAGRMVISGRMADVCAELERLAARETAVS